jgi:ribosomal protein S18 acetylase RimI-like enzyme
MTNNAPSSLSTPELVVPTTSDFAGIAILQSTAFAEKLGCEGKQESQANCVKAYRTYQHKHVHKLEHCRIIKSPDDDGTVMAACQLQAQGDPGDLTFPAGMRHTLQPGEVYVEWIACHPDHVGKGLGSQLLKWADTFAKESLHAKILTLQVMKANAGAVRLYERKGFVVTEDPHGGGACGKLASGLFIFCCLGCQYWTILYMEKDLSNSATITIPAVANNDMER